MSIGIGFKKLIAYDCTRKPAKFSGPDRIRMQIRCLQVNIGATFYEARIFCPFLYVPRK
jgi:hypothetical protein